MNLSITVPLRMNGDGAWRVGNTRVLLENVIWAFSAGATPEEIVQQFPTLERADVYAVIAHYLRNQADVDSYVQQRMELGEQVRMLIEAEQNPTGLRHQLERRAAASVSQARDIGL
ncbi:MAG: DUF433 domain-containing protein [Anaerolineae bacterium]|nr:DUF433 domain-containing protein [Thermoflexales bacterium]MDW8394763.1 DUF433 domain-containing protein [Anaerolineae bacterium]